MSQDNVLKKELINRGYTFYSDTDTEVLVNLIEEIKKNENQKVNLPQKKPVGRKVSKPKQKWMALF